MQATPLHKRFNPASLALKAAISIALSGGYVPLSLAQNNAVTEATIAFNIPAQPLGQALNELARQANLQLTFPATEVTEKRAPAVSGQLTTEQALNRLLAGSGLQATSNGSTVVVRQAASSVSTLPAVTVSGFMETDSIRNSGFRRSSNKSALGVNADIMETPATVNTLSSDFLETIGARRLEDALAYIPGVAFDTGTTGGAFPSINIRGFSSQSSTSGDIFIDGLVVNRRAYVPDLSLYDRVEILKGASSLLYGTARPGGIVQYVSKRPQAEKRTEMTFSAGSYDLKRASLDSTGALNEDKSVLYRLVATAQDVNQTFHGRNSDVSYDERYIVAPTFLFNLNEDRTLLVGLEHYVNDQIFDPGIKRVNGQFLFNSAPFVGPTSRNKREHTALRFEFDQTLSDRWSFGIGGAYQISDRTTLLDGAVGGPLNGNDLVRTRQDFRDDYAQGQIRAELNGLIPQGQNILHQVKLGIDQFKSQADVVSFTENTPNAINPFNPEFSPMPMPTGGRSQFVQKEDQLGIYVQDYLSIGERLKLYGGIRHLDFDLISEGSFNSKSEGQSTDYTMGAIYKVNSQVNPFVAYSTSTEPQSGLTSAGDQIEAREAKQIEVGVKSEWLDQALFSSVTAFKLEQTNKAEGDPLNPGFVALLGSEEVLGAELEIVGKPAPQVNMTLGYTYLDAEITESANTTLIGTSSANTPKNKFSAYVDYQLPNSQNNWTVGLGVIRVGTRQGDNSNTYELPSYTRWDARAAYTHKDWIMALGIENIFDKDYVAGTQGSSTGGGRITQGTKRFISATLTYQF